MKSTVNKMIPFKQKDIHKKNQRSKYNINNSTSSSSKVIPYPKYKKKKENGIKIIKNNKFYLVVFSLILILSVISFIDNNILKDKYSSNSKLPSSELNASSILVSKSEFSSRSKIIEDKIKNTLRLGSEYTIITKTMHKNGNIFYAQGNVSLGKNKTTSFDIVLRDKKPYSLVINGTEHIK